MSEGGSVGTRRIVAALLLVVACGDAESVPFGTEGTTDTSSTTVPSAGESTTLPSSTTTLVADSTTTTPVVSTTGGGSPPEYDFDFGALPDGTPMEFFVPADAGGPSYRGIFLAGDEFAAFNVTFSAGITGPALCTGIEPAILLLPPATLILTVARPPDVELCWTTGVRIDFAEPVNLVTIGFRGADAPYTVTAFDAADAFVSQSEASGMLGQRTEITVSSDTGATISWVEFSNAVNGLNWIQDLTLEP